MKNILIFILAIIALNVFSQKKENIFSRSQDQKKNTKALMHYVFEENTTTFQSINATGTPLLPNDWDDGCTNITPIGFEFNYNGTIYTQFSVNTNGTINIGAQQIDEETNALESATCYNLLAPLWDDLQFPNSGAGDGIFMQLDGATGNQILTIEHYQVSRYNSSGNVNFQVKLFESDNHIEFIYDDLSDAAGWSNYSTTSIGINSQENASTVFISVTPDSDSGATISTTVPNNNIQRAELSQIEPGTTYAFAPPQISDGIDIAVTGVLSPQSGLLSSSEEVKILLTNMGLPIDAGLNLNYELYLVDSGILIDTASQTFESYGAYPINTLETVEFTFSKTLDLSNNYHYQLIATASIPGDVDPTNNEKVAVVSGVIIGDTLFNNGPIVTHTDAGFNGADVSAVQQNLGMQDYGYNTSNLIGYRNADQFTVPDDEEWDISGFGFYNYQTGSDTVSTIEYVDFKIWSGAPDSGTITYDFTSENMLSASFWTGVYRTASESIDNNERPIMYNICNFGDSNAITLGTGIYWIDWSSDGELLSGPWQPFVSIVGSTTTGDGMHFGTNGWEDMVDAGTYTQQGMPFIVYGTTTGISKIREKKQDEVSISPNPATDYFVISTYKLLDGELKIYDTKGQLVLNNRVFGKKPKTDVAFLNKGMYFVNYIGKQHTFKTKLIKN